MRLSPVSAGLLVSLSPCLLVSPAQAGDWPQWLGPNRDASSTETVAPWKGEPKVLWRKPVGEGHSSPVVSNGVVYLHARNGDKNEEAVSAFDAKTGEPKWTRTYPRSPTQIPFGNGPRATPLVSGKHVYTYGITGVLTCWDLEGKQVWQVDTLKQFGAPNLFFGISCSPLLDGGLVIVQVGNSAKKPAGTGVVAFNRADGKVAWKALDDPASYASGGISNGTPVFLTGANVVAINPKNGEVTWQVPFKDRLNESSSTPVRTRNALIVSSVTAGSLGLKPVQKDGKAAAEELWRKPELNCYFATPVEAKDGKHVFMVTGSLPPLASATLHCVEAETGKVVWTKPKVGTYHASLLRLNDGNLLMLDDHGNLALVAGDVKEFKELARSKVCEGKGDVWAHPALSDGRLYLRDAKELICLELAAK